MDSIWEVLELEPTQDVSAIKQAYAKKTRICHPEEDPEGFLKLREAYQAALDYAEGRGDVSPEAQEPPAEPEAGETENGDWTLSDRPIWDEGPNPYENHEAIQKFLELYTGRQRKDSKKWLDYFTSDPFLDVAWERRFAALLLKHVTRLEAEYPAPREFLNWLCVAYQFSVVRAVYQNPDGSERTEFQFPMQEDAQFDGQEFVFEIATKDPAPKRKKDNELAMFYSFTEYRRLLRMAKENVWSEKEVGLFSQIIGRYAMSYITDRCRQRPEMDYERHPAGLRLLTHFFRREGLPEELYRIAWQKLDLENARMGRTKIFYGSLRELVLEWFPELAREQKTDYSRLRADFRDYAVSTYKRDGENAGATAEDIRRTDALFAREDFQKALLDRRMVEEELLHTWVIEIYCDYYLQRVIQFYTEHETAPCAKQVIDRAREMLKAQALADRLRRDKETEVLKGGLTLKSAPFFRHWLNTGFYQARDPKTGQGLLEYLNKELPYLPEWSRKLLEEEQGSIVPKVFTYADGGDAMEVHFHLRYQEFFLNQMPVYRPCLSWERAAALRDPDGFFFFLPITVTTYDQYEAVKEELLRRLADTAAPEDGREFIAACLAERVCALPLPGEAGLGQWWDEEEEKPEIRSLPPESLLPFELLAEDEDHLYGCEWNERRRTLFLFEQLPTGRQMLRDGLYEEVEDAGSAAALARQLLEETLRPPELPLDRLANLPDAVYSDPDFYVVCRDKDAPPLWSRPTELIGEVVTREKLKELLELFFSDRVDRLELSWQGTIPMGEEQDYEPRRSLVLLKGSGGYACLYFDDFRAKSYALLEKPELFGKVDQPLRFVSFRQGRLFSDVFHRNLSSIRRRLGEVFRQVGWPGNVHSGSLWRYAVNVAHGRHKYNLDKRLLGGFPEEWSHNRADAPFYFSLYPHSAAYVDGEGNVEALTVKESEGYRLQGLLARFLREEGRKLRLTWGKKAGQRRHIVLLRDGGRFLMAWLQEEKQTAEYHVADVPTYMDVEGKKYPKDTFRGRTTPAYLIHGGVIPLRNALEPLLAHMEEPSIITGKFAEYAAENPVKPRPYETLWAELTGDTLDKNP